MKKIALTQGKFALVDDEDFHYLSRFTWYYSADSGKAYRALTTRNKTNKRKIDVCMSDFIINIDKGYCMIGHKNHNNLDYRKENLCLVVWSSTRHNKVAIGCKNKKSKYQGVGFRPGCKIPWRVQIQKNHVKEVVGLFKSETEAALAYNKRAKELYGEFAYQNKI